MPRVGRMATLSGVVFAGLFGVGSGIWALEQPERGADTGEVLAFYEGASTQILVGGTLSLISLVFLVWFGAALRERLAGAEAGERSGLPLLAFAGAVLTAAVGLSAESINMAGALSAEDGQLTGDTAQIYFDVSNAFGAHAVGVPLAMIALAVGLVSLRGEPVVPRWGAWMALVLAVVLLTPAMLFRPAFLGLYAVVVGLFVVLSIHLDRTRDARAD